jgi:hypothetical protein
MGGTDTKLHWRLGPTAARSCPCLSLPLPLPATPPPHVPTTTTYTHPSLSLSCQLGMWKGTHWREGGVRLRRGVRAGVFLKSSRGMASPGRDEQRVAWVGLGGGEGGGRWTK